MNLRGKVIPIMDQCLRSGVAESAHEERMPIVVLDLWGISTGLVVDRVSDVLTIPAESIDPPPHALGNDEGGVIQGLGKQCDSVRFILNGNRLLFGNAAVSSHV